MKKISGVLLLVSGGIMAGFLITFLAFDITVPMGQFIILTYLRPTAIGILGVALVITGAYLVMKDKS